MQPLDSVDAIGVSAIMALERTPAAVATLEPVGHRRPSSPHLPATPRLAGRPRTGAIGARLLHRAAAPRRTARPRQAPDSGGRRRHPDHRDLSFRQLGSVAPEAARGLVGLRALRIVATNPVPAVAGVEAIYPPAWLRRSLGNVPARLLVFVWIAVRTRPDVVGAFHMLVNGLVVALLARWIGSRSMYFCVGGPVEVLDGGVHGENKYFARLKTPDALVERWLLEAIAACDLIITMGTRAVTFFRARGVSAPCHVVAGGIDGETFASPSPAERLRAPYDAVLIARLVPIKAIDIFVRAIAELARNPATGACRNRWRWSPA